jgi:hypothetical protein
LGILAICVAADAQNVNLTQSSSVSDDAPVGAGITETLQGFTEAAPELKEAQELRDTQSRGTFVGAETGDVTDFVGAAEGGTAGTTQQRRGRRGRAGMPSQPGRARGPVVRPRIVVGFRYTPSVSPAIGRDVRTSLRRIPDFGASSSIHVRVEKNVIVLEGTVASKHDSLLAAQMVALEPGVVKVDNRLTVSDQGRTMPARGR